MSYLDIPGYSGFLWLYKEFVEKSPNGSVAVEVGVALGHSVAYLARLVLDSGKDITIYAVDPWGGYARNGEQTHALGPDGTKGDFTLFLDTMRRHAPEELELIHVVRAKSSQAARMIRVADLVLIDGAHDEVSVDEDIAAWQGVIRRDGGILAGDDHEPNYPGVEMACSLWWGPAPKGYEVRGTTWVKRY
jgi:hypothetical protein